MAEDEAMLAAQSRRTQNIARELKAADFREGSGSPGELPGEAKAISSRAKSSTLAIPSSQASARFPFRVSVPG